MRRTAMVKVMLKTTYVKEMDCVLMTVASFFMLLFPESLAFVTLQAGAVPKLATN